MKRLAVLTLATGALALAPSSAYAQKVPWIVLPLLAAPVLALILSAVLGIAARSWKAAFTNAALVLLWLAWFLAASEIPAPDPLIWASVVALGLHLVALLWLIGRAIVRRRRPHEAR